MVQEGYVSSTNDKGVVEHRRNLMRNKSKSISYIKKSRCFFINVISKKKNWEMWQEGNGKDIFDVLCLNYEGNNQVK